MMKKILVDLGEFLFSIGALIFVWMELLCEFIVGFFDLFGISSFGYSEDF
jgi:hypothetical protein